MGVDRRNLSGVKGGEGVGLRSLVSSHVYRPVPISVRTRTVVLSLDPSWYSVHSDPSLDPGGRESTTVEAV